MKTSTKLRPSRSLATLSLLAALLGSASTPALAQGALIPPADIAKIVNGLLTDAKLRLHTQGEWQEKANSFHDNQSRVSVLGVTRPIPVPEVRIMPKVGWGLYYYYNANDINSEAITFQYEGGQYVLKIFFELGGSEIKGMCRWRKLINHDFTQCQPSGNDKPAPDVHFEQFQVKVPLVLGIDGSGFTMRATSCDAIDIKLSANINGVLGLGDDNAIERFIGRKLKDEMRGALCGLLGNDTTFRSSMASKTGLKIKDHETLTGKKDIKPVRFTQDGALEVKYDVVQEAALGVTASGGTCPQSVRIKAMIATDGPRELRLRIEGDDHKTDWFKVKSKEVKLFGGKGYAALVERDFDKKLGEGKHRFRVEIDGEQPTAWQDVTIKCAQRTNSPDAPPVALEVKPAKPLTAEGRCPVHVHFTGTIRVFDPGKYTYHFEGNDGANTSEKSFTANAKGKLDVYWNRRISAPVSSGPAKDLTTGGKSAAPLVKGWTKLVVKAEPKDGKAETIASKPAAFEVDCNPRQAGNVKKLTVR